MPEKSELSRLFVCLFYYKLDARGYFKQSTGGLRVINGVVELLGEKKKIIIDSGYVICELFSANKFAIFYSLVKRKIKITDGGYVICELFSANKFAIFYSLVKIKIKIIDGGYVICELFLANKFAIFTVGRKEKEKLLMVVMKSVNWF